jgi:uncharacterized protein (DUF2141 family)
LLTQTLRRHQRLKTVIFFITIIFCSAASIKVSAQKASSAGGTLTVVVSGFRNNKGNAGVALFNNANGFPKSSNKAIAAMYSKIENKKSVAVFENLSAGEYAVSVYHDENNNKKMDANFFGVPKEGVGASNNAKGHLGPPKYDDAKFDFDGEKDTVTIAIIYL